jgi:hypothetical protein
VNRFATVVALALRELWITFRLLSILALLLLAGLGASALPAVVADLSAPLAYAVALAVAMVLVTAIAAFSLASERRIGSVAWLAVRAIPRALLLYAWLTAFGAVALIGLLGSAVVAWLAIVEQPGGAPTDFGPALLAVAATLIASLAVGLLVGALLPPLPAAIVGALAGALLVVPPLLMGAALPLPGSGLALLAEPGVVARPISAALRSAGAALGLAAVAIGLAALIVRRGDL